MVFAGAACAATSPGHPEFLHSGLAHTVFFFCLSVRMYVRTCACVCVCSCIGMYACQGGSCDLVEH